MIARLNFGIFSTKWTFWKDSTQEQTALRVGHQFATSLICRAPVNVSTFKAEVLAIAISNYLVGDEIKFIDQVIALLKVTVIVKRIVGIMPAENTAIIVVTHVC